jgi:riboflavin kinase/FMN adenylyltransferase
MQHYSSLQDARVQGAWLTIGAFDGVHLGHQKVLKELTAGAHANGAPAVALSFFPHPVEVLRGPLQAFYLSSPEEKLGLLEALGLDVLIQHPFDEQMAQTPAREFVEQLKGQLDLQQLWVGHDFALGHNREGDFPTLQRFGTEMGFEVRAVGALELDGEPISSSRIRRLLGEGRVEDAARCLGRPYTLTGEVVKGAGRGASIGIPTANLQIWPKRALPASGVYVCRVGAGDHTWGAVTNIGVRPTFDEKLRVPVVETHILDYAGDSLYGKPLHLEFLARLRDEKRFAGVDELIAQIKSDIEAGREHLAAIS